MVMAFSLQKRRAKKANCLPERECVYTNTCFLNKTNFMYLVRQKMILLSVKLLNLILLSFTMQYIYLLVNIVFVPSVVLKASALQRAILPFSIG